MESTPDDIRNKKFRSTWRGFDQKEVAAFIEQLTEEIKDLKVENADLRRTLQEYEKELKEFKERENTIRNVLVNAHNTVEQMKTNAEKEARLILSEAELKAERLIQEAQQRLGKVHEDIAELKRHRIQLETRLRSTIEAYQQLLGMDKPDDRKDRAESTTT